MLLIETITCSGALQTSIETCGCGETLAAIIANAQLLLRDLPEADADTVEAIELIETAGVRAAKIVGNLLKSARKEKRDEFEEISLN